MRRYISRKPCVSILLIFVSSVGWAYVQSPADLEQKIARVLPTPEEDAFLQIPWHLNLLKARAVSARTGKPLFIWSMNGHPLGHT